MSRWCDTCNQNHGPLYLCEFYSKELQEEITEQSNKFQENLSNPTWIQEQLNNGTSVECIEIMKMFAGVTE